MATNISWVAEAFVALAMIYVAAWSVSKGWPERFGGLSFAFSAYSFVAMTRLLAHCSAPLPLRLLLGVAGIISAMAAGTYLEPRVRRWQASRQGTAVTRD